MIKIHEILSNSLLTNYSILSGKQYLGNTISAVAVFEYESIQNHCKGFRPGQFVIASYFFAESSGEIINQALSYLIKQRIGALAIKILPNSVLPNELLLLSEEYHVPIITFYEGWVEDLLININNLIKTHTSVTYQEDILRSMYEISDPTQEIVDNAISKLWPTHRGNAIVAYISQANKKKYMDLSMYVDTLILVLRNQTTNRDYHFYKFEDAILFIQIIENTSLQVDVNHFIMRLQQMLRYSKLNPDDFRIGVFDYALPLTLINHSIQKAKIANIICGLTNKKIILYSEDNFLKYVFPLKADPIYNLKYTSSIQLLKNYDKNNNSSLLDTLLLLILNKNDYKKTAEQLFSHENTIRYRQKKAIEILALPSEAAIPELDLFIKMYLIDHADDERFRESLEQLINSLLK